MNPARGDAPYFLALGDLPGGDFVSWANDLSHDGSVVVGEGTSVGGLPNEAFRWTRSSGMVGLGDLNGGHVSSARGVSADGSAVVGWAQHYGSLEAYRWTSAGMVGLGFLPGANGRGSYALGASGDGNVVVGYSYSARAPNGEAFRWTAPTGMTDLGTLPGGWLVPYAAGPKWDGSVLITNEGDNAYRWVLGQGWQALGHLPGGGMALAGAVSADGNVVVGSSEFNDGTQSGVQPFRWTPEGGMVGLGGVPDYPFGGVADDVSADGNTIIGSTLDQHGHETAFLWDAQHGMRDLQQIFRDYGVDLSRWHSFQGPFAISGDGLSMAGSGLNVNLDLEAWVAHIPEPGTLWLLALAASVALRRR